MGQQRKIKYPVEIYRRAIELWVEAQDLSEEMWKARQTINRKRIRVELFDPGFSGKAKKEVKEVLRNVMYMSRN